MTDPTIPPTSARRRHPRITLQGMVRTTLRIALVACTAASLWRPAPAAADPPFSPLQLAGRISPDPACTRVQFLGPCWCGMVPCGYRLWMYVPVAFVETVRAPGDSLLALPLPGSSATAAAGTVSSTHSSLDNTAEVHVWQLSDTAWMLSGQPPCLQCRPSDARAPAPPTSAAADAACDPASAAVAAIIANGASSVGSVVPALAYASETDEVNWRTGCRDLLAIDSWLDAEPVTLGGWGTLYPRQMRDLGTPPVVYSAKTAFRALSIARDQLGTLPYPVDRLGRMQQAYPAVSTCFDIGEQPLPQAPGSARPVQTSADGRYGWFYWRPTTCCVDSNSLSQCAGSARP
ncbi:MAG TPA: hypothetical protein VGY49_10775 [Burkholderiaceae bacterium]|nr:hypothetical protein [Burkholderiaceae bacterium]